MQRIPGDRVHNLLAAHMNASETEWEHTFVRIGPGQYWFGRRRVIVKIILDNIVVRVGGGYVELKEFLALYGSDSAAGQEAMKGLMGAQKAARASEPGSQGTYAVGDSTYQKGSEEPRVLEESHSRGVRTIGADGRVSESSQQQSRVYNQQYGKEMTKRQTAQLDTDNVRK